MCLVGIEYIQKYAPIIAIIPATERAIATCNSVGAPVRLGSSSLSLSLLLVAEEFGNNGVDVGDGDGVGGEVGVEDGVGDGE